MFRHALRLAVTVGLAALLGCGGAPTATGGADAGTGTKGPPVKVLTRVGPGSLSAHPGDAMTLSALLSESQVGPVSGGTVTWRIAADPGGTALAGTSSTTSEAGVATMQVTFGSSGTVTVRADSDGATSKAVWKIDVEPAAKHLVIVDGGPVTNVDATGLAANVSVNVNNQVSLHVRVSVEDNGADKPLPSEPVTFAITDNSNAHPSLVGGANGELQVTSQGDGEAVAVFAAGDTRTLSGPVTLAASIAGAPAVTFNIAISDTSVGGQCGGASGCPAGTVCVGGTCQSSGGGGTSCGSSDRPCPTGYACQNGQCKPAFGNGCTTCPDGTHCDDATQTCQADDPECSDTVPCPTGFNCQNGICTPGTSGIDVTGHWYTKHDFDIRQALPGWVQFSATGIRTIDQVILGQLNLPSWANAIIRGVVQQYVPQWVQQVVYILDNVLTIFSNLRSEGEMDLVANGGPTIVSGTETWTSFVFYLLSQCGSNIGGDPSSPPPCARVDIYTDELSQADLSVTVDPFAAKVGGDQTNGYTLIMDHRLAHMKLAGILKYVLEQMIQVTTGYPSLEDQPCGPNQDPSSGECGPGSGALSNLVDCPSLAQSIMDMGVPVDVTVLCQAAVTAAGQYIVQQLAQATVSQDVLEFHGQASARATQGNPSYADELGYPDYETRANPDGEWTAKFHIAVSVHDVPGRWRASREPFVDGQ